MERPAPELEVQLNTLGIYTLEGAAIEGEHMLGVEIEIPMQAVEGWTPPNFRMRTVSKRGVIFDFGEWQIHARDGVPLLYCQAFMPMPKEIAVPEVPTFAQSFMDICWKVGVEPVEGQAPEQDVPLRAGASYKDVGWYLPSRFLDHFIDSVGKLNEILLDGAMGGAVVYTGLRR